MARPGGDEPLYTISIAARLVRPERPDEPAIHPQTLRMYERWGLVTPKRIGKNRLYSDRDIERVRQIQRFTQEMGVNLAGVEVILSLLERLEQMQREMDDTREALRRATLARAAPAAAAATVAEEGRSPRPPRPGSAG